MTTRPPFFGLHLPCTFDGVLGDDTIKVVTRDGRIWIVTLIGVSCFDHFSGDKKLSAEFIKETLKEAEGEVSLLVCCDEISAGFSHYVSGHIFIGSDSCLADMIVHAGHGMYV